MEGAPGYRGPKPPAGRGGDEDQRQALQPPISEPKTKAQIHFIPQILEKSAKAPQANDGSLKSRVSTLALTPALQPRAQLPHSLPKQVGPKEPQRRREFPQLESGRIPTPT